MLVKKIIKTLLISILSLFFIFSSFSMEPKEFVQQTVDKAARALDQNLSKELKINIVARIKEQLRYQSEINPTQSGHSENDCKVLDRFLTGEIKI